MSVFQIGVENFNKKLGMVVTKASGLSARRRFSRELSPDV